MNILLISLIFFASPFTARGVLKPSINYLKGMSEQLAKEKCISECYEKKDSCPEYHSHAALCESLKETVYEENYATCFRDCISSIPRESSIVCSYDCIRSTYRMEGVRLPKGFFNEFIDSLTENGLDGLKV